MDEQINLTYLSHREADHYKSLLNRTLTVREEFKASPVCAYGYWIAMTLSSLTILGSFPLAALFFPMDEPADAFNDEFNSYMSVVFGITSFFIVIGMIFFFSRRPGLKQYRLAEATAYLKRINYSERPKQKSSSSSGNGREPSLRELQHAWYEGHNELNWRDREYAEQQGMSASEYISNVLEDDRD